MMPGYHGKKKKMKKKGTKRVKSGYGSMKKVKASAKKKKVKAGYGAMKKKRVMAKAKKNGGNGLTPAQKKLPMALQKAILKKKKKK